MRVDPLRGVVGAAHPVCAPGEVVLSLAVAPGRSGEPVAYLGLWRDAAAGLPPAGGVPPGGRIVAIDPVTGTVLRAAPIAAIAASLAVVPAQPGAPARLLCGCGSPGANQDGRAAILDDFLENGARWQIVDLDVETLAPSAVYPVPARPYALQAAPDGGAAYVLTGGTAVGTRAGLVHLDLRGGTARTLILPTGRAGGLAVGAEHVYVPHLDGRVVWVVDRRRGQLVGTISVGPRPIAVALSSGAPAPTAAHR
jgi:hypothetical protein